MLGSLQSPSSRGSSRELPGIASTWLYPRSRTSPTRPERPMDQGQLGLAAPARTARNLLHLLLHCGGGFADQERYGPGRQSFGSHPQQYGTERVGTGRGSAIRLITRRSWVQIPPPPPTKSVATAGLTACCCGFRTPANVGFLPDHLPSLPDGVAGTQREGLVRQDVDLARTAQIILAALDGHVIQSLLRVDSASSKYAVEALNDALRLELEPFGIHVAIIEPGSIRTEWGAIAADKLLATSGHGACSSHATAVAAALANSAQPDARMTSSPGVGARAVTKAAIARRPRTRYRIGFGARPLVLPSRVLPARRSTVSSSARSGPVDQRRVKARQFRRYAVPRFRSERSRPTRPALRGR
ncbi:hypothetical protein BH10ACT3_BH10ACT3_14480 [soil metagenome]